MPQESIADALERNTRKIFAAVELAVDKEIRELGGTPTVREQQQKAKKGPPSQDCIAALNQLGDRAVVYITQQVDTISDAVVVPPVNPKFWQDWQWWCWKWRVAPVLP